jgi:hypothetical protein
VTPSDLEVANSFARRWRAMRKERRSWLGKEMPVAEVQAAALHHPHVEMRRLCLFLLDHYASDLSAETFRLALRDPVASVREGALHGLACETCRHEDIRVVDAVSDLARLLATDANADVRHKAVAALARFLDRDSRVRVIMADVAHRDRDTAVRAVAQSVADSGRPHIHRRKRALRETRRTARVAAASPSA